MRFDDETIAKMFREVREHPERYRPYGLLCVAERRAIDCLEKRKGSKTKALYEALRCYRLSVPVIAHHLRSTEASVRFLLADLRMKGVRFATTNISNVHYYRIESGPTSYDELPRRKR